jgi:serralysin
MSTYIDALVYSWSNIEGGFRSWSPTLGSPADIRYSFDPDLKFKDSGQLTSPAGNFGYGLTDSNGWRDEITASQQAAVTSAFSKWASVAQINYAADTTGNPNLVFFAATAPGGSTAPGVTWSDASNHLLANADIALTQHMESTTVGQYGFETIMHELGHAFGLNHPGDSGTTAGFTRDTTIMSYNAGSVVAGGLLPNAATPMIYDIAAAQALYGADVTPVSHPVVTRVLG